MASTVDLNPFRTGTISVDEGSRASLRSLGASGTDRDFSGFAEASREVLLSSSSADEVSALGSHPFVASAGASSASVQALVALLVDYARCNTPASAVASALEDFGFKASRAKILGDLLSASAEAIRARLVRAGASLPRIVDLKWRLDYVVATSDGGKVGTPLYLIDLHLAAPTGLPFVHRFTCTPPELEELRSKVKDALRAATALAASSSA